MRRTCVLTVVLLVGLAWAIDWWQFRGLDGNAIMSVAAQGPVDAYATTNMALFCYDDGGGEWDTMYLYSPSGRGRGYVQLRYPDVYLAWGRGSRSDGLWRTTDNGQSWDVLRYMLFPRVLLVRDSLVFLAGDTLDQGVWRSTDQGQSWVDCDSGLAGARVQSMDLSYWNADSVLCGTRSSGAFVSADRGLYWQPLGPFAGRPVPAVCWPGEWSERMLLAVGGDADSAGLWSSTDGQVWVQELSLSNPTCFEESGRIAGCLGDSGTYFCFQDTWRPFCDSLDNRNVLCLSGLGFTWAGTEDGVYMQDQTPGVAQEGDEGGVMRDGTRMPTIVRGMLAYQPTANRSQPAVGLLDITGRRVMSLHSGQNDVRHIAPGVYFVREEVEPSDGTCEDAEHRGPGSKGSSVRKIVIQR
jgi:hypothetical protein